MKILYEYRATHAVWFIWDSGFDGGIHFQLGLRKGQCQVRLGKTGKIFKFKFFLQKHAFLVQFSLRILKIVFMFIQAN